MSLSVHLAVLLYAMSSWISINAIYVQLPILGNVVPESWNIATYIVLFITISCIFPLVYGLIKHRFNQFIMKIESLLILCMMGLTLLGLFLSTVTYKSRTVLFGEEHSVALWVIFFIVAIPCTVSDVLFLPYMDHFKDHKYLTTFFVGLGLGALVPSCLSFIQGSPTVTKVYNNESDHDMGFHFEIDANLSFESFMYINMGFVCSSIISFVYIVYWVKRSNKVKTIYEVSRMAEVDEVKEPIEEHPHLKITTIVMLSTSFIIGALQNSMLPVLVQYASQGYGQKTYHLANTLFIMTNPIFCLLQMFVTISRFKVFFGLFIVTLLPTLFIMILACISTPIAWSGITTLLCICAALSSGLLAWTRTAVTQALRATRHPRALFWCGAATQFGSCIGSLLMFGLANGFHVFAGS